MRQFYRRLALALCALLALAGLSACGRETQVSSEDAAQELNLYASFYPIYALTAMVAQDVPGVQLHCLVQPQDGCLRAYALSDWDYALLSRAADAVILGGRGLEGFESLLYALGDAGPAVSTLLTNVELAEQQAESVDEEPPEHWQGGNPHIYMSLSGAAELLQRAAGALCVLDPGYEARYLENLASAEAALSELSEALKSELADWAGAPVAVLNEALVYSALDYDMEIACCYARESGEELDQSATEACLAAISASGAQAVLIEKQAPTSLVDALEAEGFAVARMDVLSTRRADEGAEGYFQAQRENAAALRAALEAASEGDGAILREEDE